MYIILDPINDTTKGITTYSNLLYKLLCKNNIKSFLIRKRIGQNIKEFYREIENSINLANHIIEIPDTFCYLFNAKASLHIRLHGNHSLLQKVQGNKINEARQIAESEKISLAQTISSPSESNYLATLDFIHLSKCLIFPNPVPIKLSSAKYEKRDIEILFLGRFHRLKGVEFIQKIEKILHKKILIYTESEVLFQRLFYKFIPTTITKENILSRSKVVIIPSLFESFSMVKYEALSCGCKVVIWDTTPCSQAELQMGVYTAQSFNIRDFADKINLALNDNTVYPYKTLAESINASVIENIKKMMEQPYGQ